MKTIEERLDILEEKMRSETFRANTGLGNEVGYYVFDYEPYDELKVRERIKHLCSQNTIAKFGYQLVIYDLYELMIRLLEEEGVLEDLKTLEEDEGTDYVFSAISDVLRFDEQDSLIVNTILEQTPGDSVVFLTGVGKCFPIQGKRKWPLRFLLQLLPLLLLLGFAAWKIFSDGSENLETLLVFLAWALTALGSFGYLIYGSLKSRRRQEWEQTVAEKGAPDARKRLEQIESYYQNGLIDKKEAQAMRERIINEKH